MSLCSLSFPSRRRHTRCLSDWSSDVCSSDLCPNGQLVLVDTVFTTIIQRDSAYRGYAQSHHAPAATAANEPGAQSRPFFTFDTLFSRVRSAPNSATDTSTVPIFADSALLRVVIVRHDTSAKNLRLLYYALPVSADSQATFGDLDPYFSGPVVDSVNVSDLLTRPLITDTATVRIWRDTIQTDSAGHVLRVRSADSALEIFSSLDTLQAPFSDTGRVAYGVRVLADSAVSITLATNESGDGSSLEWFYHYTPKDSLTAKHDSASRVPRFDSFVFDPPSQPLDSNLVMGGAPSARSLIRVQLPAFIQDSVDIVRATLILVPTGPVAGIASDSFRIAA